MIDVFQWLSLHSIKLNINITTQMSLTLSICVLFVLFMLMQLINAAQFSNITFYLSLFAAAVFVTDIVLLKMMYASL